VLVPGLMLIWVLELALSALACCRRLSHQKSIAVLREVVDLTLSMLSLA